MPNNVKTLRLAQHISQKDLAASVGITRQTLSLIEKFDYNPSLKLCILICQQLNQTLDAVFWPTDNEGKSSI